MRRQGALFGIWVTASDQSAVTVCFEIAAYIPPEGVSRCEVGQRTLSRPFVEINGFSCANEDAGFHYRQVTVYLLETHTDHVCEYQPKFTPGLLTSRTGLPGRCRAS